MTQEQLKQTASKTLTDIFSEWAKKDLVDRLIQLEICGKEKMSTKELTELVPAS
jgi:hypothetical protein